MSRRVASFGSGSFDYSVADALGAILITGFEAPLIPPVEYAVRGNWRTQVVARRQALFDTSAFVEERLSARSADGTRVPYIVIRPKALLFNGDAPTLMESYGAFGQPEWQGYVGDDMGSLWLSRGGVYVIAMARGGGDLGPEWHVVRSGRRRTYEDAVAVARDLFRRKITSPARLGITGHSAGGLLAAVMATNYGSVFNAVVLRNAYLDLFRPPNSDMGLFQFEFGDPTIPSELAVMKATSPFQALRAGARFPDPLIITSTDDQVVLPDQARRFAAKAESLGLPCLFFEAAGGGHSTESSPAYKAQIQALIYTYLAARLMK